MGKKPKGAADRGLPILSNLSVEQTINLTQVMRECASQARRGTRIESVFKTVCEIVKSRYNIDITPDVCFAQLRVLKSQKTDRMSYERKRENRRQKWQHELAALTTP